MFMSHSVKQNKKFNLTFCRLQNKNAVPDISGLTAFLFSLFTGYALTGYCNQK